MTSRWGAAGGEACPRNTGRHVAAPAPRRRRAPTRIAAFVAAALGAALAVVAMTWSGSPGVPPTTTASGRSATAQDSNAPVTPTATAERASHPRPTPSGADPTAEAPRWQGVLRQLDDRRARAWRTGRPQLLRRVYTHGSPSLRRDVAMLTSYLERGLRVPGVHVRYLAVSATGQRGEAVRLTTVDRLAPLSARTAVDARMRLPRDRPSRHVIALRRVEGCWRIAWIRVA